MSRYLHRACQQRESSLPHSRRDVPIERLDPPGAMRPWRCRITIGGERPKTSTSSRTARTRCWARAVAG